MACQWAGVAKCTCENNNTGSGFKCSRLCLCVVCECQHYLNLFLPRAIDIPTIVPRSPNC